MKFYSALILSFGCLLATACENTKSSPATQDSSHKSGNEDGSADDATSDQLEDSTATIQSMTYDAEKHAITLKLSYSGCAQTKHQLILDGICAESYPMQCGASLKRPKDFDGSCKMAIEEEVVLNLEDSFDTSVVRVRSNGKTSQVLVDREGKTQNLQP